MTVAIERFGFDYHFAWDGISLSVLLIMIRTSNRHNGIKNDGWSCDEMDLAEWMEANNKQPGDDMSEFFEV